ncbi:hypothetical protein Bhyg_09255, partial [Pseudolycoriella hygida]
MDRILFALLIFCGANAVVYSSRISNTVPYVIGGSHIKIPVIQIEEKAEIKCLVRFPDDRDYIKLDPAVPRDRRSVICRLPSHVDSGSVDIDVEVTAENKSTKNVIHSGTYFINPGPTAEIDFFDPRASIMMQVSLYVSESKEPVFTESEVVILAGANKGTAKISITNANKNIISNLFRPYYYVLRPVGTQSSVFLSSGLFRPSNSEL